MGILKPPVIGLDLLFPLLLARASVAPCAVNMGCRTLIRNPTRTLNGLSGKRRSHRDASPGVPSELGNKVCGDFIGQAPVLEVSLIRVVSSAENPVTEVLIRETSI
jgi:hypothetical protein